MKKYNTKPIDFTGCHPVIAEHLKRGEAIECLVWDWEGVPKIKAWVYGYAQDTTYKYKTKEDKYACAEPIPSKGRHVPAGGTTATTTRPANAKAIAGWRDDEQ